MLADEPDYVVVSTPIETSTPWRSLGAPAGALFAQRSVRASARGYAAAVHFADTHANGARVWVVEGAGHYGAGLARYLSGCDEGLLEFRRGRGISVAGTPERGAVVQRARELVEFARSQGYRLDELVEIIEDVG